MPELCRKTRLDSVSPSARRGHTFPACVRGADFKIFTDFSKIVKLEFFVFIGAVVAVNLSNYIKIENGKISTTSDYPSKYSDPEFKYICIFEYVK